MSHALVVCHIVNARDLEGLRSYPNVQNWLNELEWNGRNRRRQAGVEGTKIRCLRALHDLCEWTGKDPNILNQGERLPSMAEQEKKEKEG